MPVADAEVAVLIVGGGPVGLTARVLLERWGVPTLLVEKHRELSPFPRSRLVNTRSMEIYRQLGLDAKITARAFAPEYGRVRFRDTLLTSGSPATAPPSTPSANGTLLTPDPAHWEQPITAPWPLRIESLSKDHIDLCDVGPHGALLVRPDGHIAAHWRDAPPSHSLLHHVLTTITASA